MESKKLLTVEAARKLTNCRLRFGDTNQIEAIDLLELAAKLKRLRSQNYPEGPPPVYLDDMNKMDIQHEIEYLEYGHVCGWEF